jgi:Flp pilus assembly protein TadG
MRGLRTNLPSNKLPRSTSRHGRHKRLGAVLVWFAFLLVVLLGMVGLVIDGGLLMASHRHAQNAADAAALAAAHDIMYGAGNAQGTADTYVKTHNGLSNATVTVNMPPTSGHHMIDGYVEVIVDDPVSTFFIHILPGVNPDQTVRARAVAGSEMVTAGAGVCVLDPDARPGLTVGGIGRLVVNGLVIDNSEGGGVDEYGVDVNNGNTGTAASVSNAGQFLATNVRVVGGVNNPDNFEPYYAGDPSPLHCNQLPFPDPLLTLATPTVNNGVVNENRGDPNATNLNPVLNDPSGLNYIANYVDNDPYYIEDPVNDPDNVMPTMVLHPGIYNSIDVTGGKVYLIPGIYVLSSKKQNQDTVNITGGNVFGKGIMIYNTGNSYDAISGAPDVNDKKQKPPIPGDDSLLGAIKINAAMLFSPIDVTEYNYGNPPRFTGDVPVSSEFDGMLFYQRRGSSMGLDIQGDAEEGMLEGTLYAKWGHTKISGQGTYDAQFVVGSMAIDGQGDVTINFVGGKKGKAPQVFLVE